VEALCILYADILNAIIVVRNIPLLKEKKDIGNIEKSQLIGRIK
jgi:hypothetical protein